MVLTGEAFAALLVRLDPADEEQASEKYKRLQEKLIKCLGWRGCPESQAEALADETLDRVANKLLTGETIENLAAYACKVLDYVWLEYRRKRKEDDFGDDRPEDGYEENWDELFAQPDLRMRCLRKCLAEDSNDIDREIIIGWYSAEAGEKNKDVRDKLAIELGIDKKLLKVKACRLRDRLEKCINLCVQRLTVTKKGADDTYNKEAR